MAKRMAFMLVAVIAFVAIIGGFKYSQIKAAMAQGGYQAPPEAVTTVVAKAEPWNTTLNAIGTVAAAQGVTVSADLPGLVSEIDFDSGRAVTKGDVLIRLDTKQERAQLAAAEAQVTWTKLSLDRAREMSAKGIAAQEAFDRAAADFKQAEARVGEIRASIDRKTIRAPFSGALGIRQVNLGQYLAGGAPIVTLQALRPAYVNFSVPQQEIGHLSIGSVVDVTSDALGGAAESGKIKALESVIDETTRNVRVQAVFDNASGKLRPGMFVEARLAHGAPANVAIVPASAISYAPFGDSVFIVENVKGPDGKSFRGVRQQFVKLAGARGDQVGVLTGVKPGEEVVTSGVFKLRPGAAVIVNNAVQPSNSAKPKPEDS
jgi:membrane fusion protein (multidrug efflux system)